MAKPIVTFDVPWREFLWIRVHALAIKARPANPSELCRLMRFLTRMLDLACNHPSPIIRQYFRNMLERRELATSRSIEQAT